MSLRYLLHGVPGIHCSFMKQEKEQHGTLKNCRAFVFKLKDFRTRDQGLGITQGSEESHFEAVELANPEACLDFLHYLAPSSNLVGAQPPKPM